jgi:hypothetical protein
MSAPELFYLLSAVITAVLVYLQKQILDLQSEIKSLKELNTKGIEERGLIESVLQKIALIIMRANKVPLAVKNEVQQELNKLELFRNE